MLLSSLLKPLLAAGLVLSPAMLHAQIGASTACKDGTLARTGGISACAAHGGVDERRTASVRAVERSQRGAVAGKAAIGTPHATPRTGSARTSGARSSGPRLPRIGRRPSDASPAIPMPDESRAPGGGRVCKDGTVLYGKGRNGNCGRHGGTAPHGVRTDARHGRHEVHGQSQHGRRGDRDDDDRGGEHGKGHGHGHGKRA